MTTFSVMWPTHSSSIIMTGTRNSSARLKPVTVRSKHSCGRSEEHTSELQSLRHLVCRLLLVKREATGAAAQQIAGCGAARFLAVTGDALAPARTLGGALTVALVGAATGAAAQQFFF